jgi:lipopolysaccharide transport system permease protein
LIGVDLRELWHFRELVFFLTWRDVLVRYKQTLLGGSWAILRPLLQMVIFNFIFGNVAGLSSGGVPRPLFTYAALLPWDLFANAVGHAGHSLVTNRNMITKTYFPRIIIPLSNILGGVLDFLIGAVVLGGMMIYFGFVPNQAIWILPLYMVLTMITAFGVGLWLSALDVHYRDVKYIIPFLTQLWMLVTPIAYESKEIFNRIPDSLHWLFALNPMVGVIEGFRNALLGTPIYSTQTLWISIIAAFVLFFTGLLYFRSMERTFADTV